MKKQIKSSSVLKINSLTTSEGNQIKYNYKGLIIKIDLEYEGLIESFVTLFLKAIDYPYPFIEYSPCLIEDKKVLRGCKCKDCLCPNDEDISFYDYLSDNNALYCFNGDKYSTLEKFKISTEGLPEALKEELISMLFIDCLVLNADRHLNNIRLIKNVDKIKLFPAFDFGDSLLQSDYDCLINDSSIGSLTSSIRKAKCKPFCKSIKSQFKLCQSVGYSLKLPSKIQLPLASLYEYYDAKIIGLMLQVFRMNLRLLGFDTQIEVLRDESCSLFEETNLF